MARKLKYQNPVPNEGELFLKWNKLVPFFIEKMKNKYGEWVASDELESDLNFALLKAIRTFKPKNPKKASRQTYYCRVMYNEITKSNSQLLMTGSGLGLPKAEKELTDPLPLPEIDSSVGHMATMLLSPLQNVVIDLRVMKRLTRDEIADRLGITPVKVRSLEMQAIKLMKTTLIKHGVEDVLGARFVKFGEDK